MFNNKEYLYKNISTQTGTLVATGRGVLHSIVVNSTAAGSIVVADAVTATTPIIGTLKASVVEGTYLYDAIFSKGLYVTTNGASDITVCYSQP